jgi:hypothetical protein
MIDNLLNLLFRCPHKRLTRPFTPVARSGDDDLSTYVGCLDCGKRFAYDPKEMRIGKPMVPAAPAAPEEPKKRRFRYTLWMSMVFGSVFMLKNWLIRRR